MRVSIESTQGLERRMTVELPAERVDGEVEKRLRHLAKTVRMDGFRPGKVPFNMVLKRYGDQVRHEVFGELIQSTYGEALRQENLHPAGRPSNIEPEDKGAGNGVSYVATFEVLPEVKLGDLATLSVTRPQAEVTDADVEAMIEKLRKQRTRWNKVERPAADGDRLIVSFEGRIDGETFEGGSADDVPVVLGAKGMIPGFEEGLVGAAPGEERTLEVRFPDDYHAKELAGKPASFQAKVAEVQEPELPEVDDAFIRLFGVQEGGVEAFRKEVRGNMERELQEKIGAITKERVMDALLASTELSAPKALVEEECASMRDRVRSQLGTQAAAGGFELPLSLFEEQAARRVKLGLLIAEVVKANGIKVDQDRVRQRVEAFAQTYERPQEVVKFYYSNRGQLGAVENLVLEDQVVDWVLERVQAAPEPTSFDALMNPQAAQRA
jgi:trigger factor